MQSLGDVLKNIAVKKGPTLPERVLTPPCPICGGQRWVSMMGLHPGDDHFGEAFPCACTFTGKETLEGFNVDPAHPDLAAALEATRRWLDGSGPGMLILSGPRGVGKSHLLLAAKNELQRQRLPYVFYTDRKLDSAMRASFDSGTTTALLNMLGDEPNLFIDDYGTIARTPGGNLEGLVDDMFTARWNGVKDGATRTMVTHNLTADELEKISPRILSRFNDQTYSWFKVIDAPDYRLKKREE